jgi:hypothetical protein
MNPEAPSLEIGPEGKEDSRYPRESSLWAPRTLLAQLSTVDTLHARCIVKPPTASRIREICSVSAKNGRIPFDAAIATERWPATFSCATRRFQEW